MLLLVPVVVAAGRVTGLGPALALACTGVALMVLAGSLLVATLEQWRQEAQAAVMVFITGIALQATETANTGQAKMAMVPASLTGTRRSVRTAQ